MSYNFQPLQDVMNNWAANDTTRYNFHEPKPNNIIFMQGQTEMLNKYKCTHNEKYKNTDI
jgi:hypothetical protein